MYLNDSGSLLVPSLIQTNLLQLSCFKYILSCSCSSTLWLILHIFRECNYNCNSDSNLLKSYTVLLQNCATATMQKLWEVQPQGLVLVLHPGQVQLCNCNNLKVAESTNWIASKNGEKQSFSNLGAKYSLYIVQYYEHLWPVPAGA